MILANALGQFAHPFYVAFAWLLENLYAFIPNFAIAIALLTLIVMVIVFPITLKGTRGMMKMQLLAPELKKLQAKYKVQPGMSVAERQDLRQRQQEEMMALYKENNVSPAGGCLPMFLQFPIFIILYGTIRGLLHVTTIKTLTGTSHIPDPLYVSHTSKIYLAIQNAHGELVSFGVNLANSVRTSGISSVQKIPLVVMILVAIALQYIQMKQMSGRNPAAAAANPQMQQMQKIFPLIFAVIYISIPAGVNVYFIVSSLFRIAQQEVMYRRDPHIQASMAKLSARAKTEPKVVEAKAKTTPPSAAKSGLRDRLRNAASQQAEAAANKKMASESTNGKSVTPHANGSTAATPNAQTSPPKPPSTQPRAQGKRQRKTR